MSFTNKFIYKNWNFSFMLIAKLGHKYRKDAFTGSNIQNRHVGERWRKPGDESKPGMVYPVLMSWNMDMFYYPYVDALVGNAGYAKLRDVTLSYDFSKKWTNSIGLGSAKLYVQARNLFTIKGKGVDIDPESFELNLTGATASFIEQGFTSLPLPTEYFVGLQITF
jgi:hypothetical protein